MELPEAMGTYVLILHLPQMKRLEIGRLGTFDLVPGFYAYLFARRAHPFLKRVWAPEYLCIRKQGLDSCFKGWTDFRDWQKPLGRVVEQNLKKPKYVVSGQNWPWNVMWLYFPHWGGEFGGPCGVFHRPEITPTEQEERDFCLPGIPPQEWPAPPQPPGA